MSAHNMFHAKHLSRFRKERNVLHRTSRKIYKNIYIFMCIIKKSGLLSS